MAPLLIDSKDLVKFGLIAVIVTITVFTGGFLIGYHQATNFYFAGSEVQALPLPGKIANDEAAELQLPTVIEAGAEIDVDQPGKADQLHPPVLANKTKSSNAVQIKSQSGSSVKKSEVKIPVAEATKKKMRGKTAATVTADNKTQNVVQLSKQDIDSAIVVVNKKVVDKTFKAAVFTAEELQKIKYSIQVGMYGRLINAENMMQMLQAQQLDAYITDYTNKKNEIRYNVRFGYFSDKKSALNKLNTFKNIQKGDGYLVKFTSENIVNLANVEELNMVDDIEKKKEVKSPSVNSSDVSSDKVS